MSDIKIGITGANGRIGGLVLRAAIDAPDIEIVGVNATVKPDYLAYLIKYDSVHGQFQHDITHTNSSIVIDGKEIPVTVGKDAAIPDWTKTDYLVDASGAYKTMAKAQVHLTAGAKKVVITAPDANVEDVTAPNSGIPMFVMGVNHLGYNSSMDIVSNASCTTNCLAPITKVLNDKWGVEKGLMTTIHAITATQKTVDGKSEKEWRSGRAAGFNIIPSPTGAARAIGRVIPSLNGKLTGTSFRVPVQDVSVVDLVATLIYPASWDEICAEMKRASEEELKGILGYTEDAVVSSDFIHDDRTSIFDKTAGIALDSHFVKLISWYDNEWAYSCKVLDLVRHMYATDNSK